MKKYMMNRIRQRFPDNEIKDIRKACRKELEKLKARIKPEASVAIAVGSRGIHGILHIIHEVVEYVKEMGAEPFIVPAMGSHGGATAEGQLEILGAYGITEKNTGIPIRSSMEVVEIKDEDLPISAYMDKNAYESDGIILVNRIKPHTDYHATYESGLVKMAAIGLGNEHGASSIHHYGIEGLTNLIPRVADVLFKTGKILGGLALVENANEKTMLVRGLAAEDFFEEEPKLLEISKENMPEFPVDRIDVLVIDRMGKNISGVGIDTNIIGRLGIPGQPRTSSLQIRSIVVTDLTEESHGNAIGVGLADVITRQLFDKIDFNVTKKNVSTSSFLQRGKIPLIADGDFEALQLALRNEGAIDGSKARIIRIKDTLHLSEMYVSDEVLKELRDDPRIEDTGERIPLFGSNGELTPF